MPQEIRDSIKYATSVKECRNTVRCYESIPELTKMKAPINKSQEATFEKQISTARQELEELKSNETIDFYHQRDLILKIETEFQRLDKEVTDQFLNVEVRDGIDLIEKTLAEPHLYSLPHLTMWRNHRRQVLENTIKNGGGPLGGVWGGPTWGGLGGPLGGVWGGATWGGLGGATWGGLGGGHWEVY